MSEIPDIELDSDAIISDCSHYRYTLTRRWSSRKTVMFIGLNPSTADASEDDPTIRKCIRFARDWEFGQLVMTNLFAFRATNPKEMITQSDPVGEFNDAHLHSLASKADLIVAAWGTRGVHLGRDQVIRRSIPNLHHIGLTRHGHPRHPLYVKATAKPQPF